MRSASSGPVRVAFARNDGTIDVETVEVTDGAVPSIVDLVPAASWDEREAHDLYGIRFDGHEPLRPLVNHDLDLESWTVAVQGPDAYQVAVGPIHAGVIESGHFRFHLVGEKILHLDARLFYKHRGLERAAEGAELDDGIRYMARACAACAVTNGVAYAQAVEQLLGYRAGRELARARTVLLELERVWSHLNDVSAVCAGTGLAAGAQRFAGLTERARRLNAELTGHRFLFGSVSVRGSRLDSGRKRDPGCAARARRAPGAKRPPAGASSSSTARSRIGFPESASFARETPAASARRARQRARRVSRRTRGRPARTSRTTASCPRSRPALSATCKAAWSSVTSSSSSPSSFSRRSSTGRSSPARPRTEA